MLVISLYSVLVLYQNINVKSFTRTWVNLPFVMELNRDSNHGQNDFVQEIVLLISRLL